MILINSRFEYFNTFYGCVIGKDYVYTKNNECMAFVPKGKTLPYWKVNGKIISIKKLLNHRYLVRMQAIEAMPF